MTKICRLSKYVINFFRFFEHLATLHSHFIFMSPIFRNQNVERERDGWHYQLTATKRTERKGEKLLTVIQTHHFRY